MTALTDKVAVLAIQDIKTRYFTTPEIQDYE